MGTLTRIALDGYKSIKQMSLELRQLNVLIGANGSGKTNLVSFLKLLNEMLGERLQIFIGTSGGAQSLLHYGSKTTPQIQASLEFDTPTGLSTYYLRLFHAAVDTLIFGEERLTFQGPGFPRAQEVVLGSGHRETLVRAQAEAGNQTARVFRDLLRTCRVFQFHDTSASARIRQQCYIEQNRFLMPDAGNLPAVLHRIRSSEPTAYRRIVSTVQQVAPFFDDFVLAPSPLNDKYITLNWREKGTDTEFGPHVISDGTLRAMALITLLLQPEEDLPAVIVIDEPELGLHPYAINVLASLLAAASLRCQVIVATQSVPLLDQFEPEDVVVVERDGAASTFQRLDPEKLRDWLGDYSLGQLWEKNVIGGGPA